MACGGKTQYNTIKIVWLNTPITRKNKKMNVKRLLRMH
ncbi:MAG: hypothetical protein Rpha_0054 [Candidatus Ruthia sp. Apha_13_S6]|nr:hypothetical protein [Candidatus Ruthia sp. Apha_13_S6]